MKKDMSHMTTEKNKLLNGDVKYINDIYYTLDQHLTKHKQQTSEEERTDETQIKGRQVIHTRDAQNQTSNDSTSKDCSQAAIVGCNKGSSEASSRLKMTIKSIIKEKISELQSFDTGQLKNKLLRMEEENFNLRNRAMVLEERINFLEKRNVNNHSKNDDGDNSNTTERETCDKFTGASSPRQMISLVPTPLHEDENGGYPENGIMTMNSPASPFRKTSPDCRSCNSNTASPVSPACVLNTNSPGNSTITRASTEYDNNTESYNNNNNKLSLSQSNSPKKDSRLPYREMNNSSNTEISTAPELDRAIDIRPVTPEHNNNISLVTPRTQSKDISFSREGNRTLHEISASVRGSNRATLELAMHVPDASTYGADQPRLEVPPRKDALSLLPRETNTSLDMTMGCDTSRPKEMSADNYVASAAVSMPLPMDLLAAIPPKSSPGTASFSDPNVRQYESNLLSSGPPVNLRQQHRQQATEIPRLHAENNLYSRETDFRVHDKAFPHEMDNTRVNPENQISRSNSESSIYPSNCIREKRNSTSSASPTRGNFKANEIRVGEEVRTVREYRQSDMSVLSSSEKKIEKVINPYANGYGNVQPSLNNVLTARGCKDTYRHAFPNCHPSSSDIMQRYDSNMNTQNIFSVSTSNPIMQQSLKRSAMALVEYEPLSKVMSQPPPLIPSPNLPSPNRYQVRHMSIPRNPMVPSNYPPVAQNYPPLIPAAYRRAAAPTYPQPPSTEKYNVSATNFHATSRSTNYTIPNANFTNASYGNPYSLPLLVAHITSDKSSIIFTWDKVKSQISLENVNVYFLFAFHTLDLNQPPPKEVNYWKRISVVEPLPLPIACTLTQSFDGQNYFFAVAPVDRAGRVGLLSNPCALKVAL